MVQAVHSITLIAPAFILAPLCTSINLAVFFSLSFKRINKSLSRRCVIEYNQ